jgi:ketohexokinase
MDADDPRTPHFPEEDSKLRATSISRRRGGNCPNSAEVITQILQNGTQPKGPVLQPLLISTVPNSASLDYSFIRDSLKGVSIEHCIQRPSEEAPKSYIIRSKATGSRTIVNYNELDEMTTEEFEEVFEQISVDVCWWHFEVHVFSRYVV